MLVRCSSAGGGKRANATVGLWQVFVERGEYEAGRTLRYSGLGLLLTGPTLHLWYAVLNRRFPGVAPARVLARVALDQALFAPAFTAAFLSVLLAVEGRSADEWRAYMRESYAESVCVNWVLWIPAQLINFRFTPPAYTVLFANFVAVFWNS